MSHSVTFTPIAYVQSQFDSNTPAEEMRQHRSQIIIEPQFEAGLLGLEAGTDIIVLMYFHHIQPDEVDLQLHPRHNEENPLRGVFATRSQFRPNPIGATVAHIEAIEGRVITVTKLDGLDGTPVLDIKPFAAYFDTDTERQRLEVREVMGLPEAREAIDLIDAEVIRLLGNRAGFVRQVVKFKKTLQDVRAPDRYAQVMQRRREMAQAEGLNPDVVERMYKLLVENFIQEEIELLHLQDQA